MRLTLPMLNILSILLLVAGCVAPAKKKDDATANVAKMKLASHAQSLKTFAEEQKGNMKYGILIDMSIPSWKKRFFVVDLETDSVLVAGMCTHGQGDDYQREEVVFSNVPNSLCTSEG
ncbi:MAG: murein L,D-transpeptidase catalytic domain family protein, partial [Bacteroidetes bacterium]|nr:murein L,D-transpeptidase catalytic domain family protein [Bacteroidota bacterium]